MIQTVEIDVMNGRYTIEANVELKVFLNYDQVEGYRHEWDDFEYIRHDIVSVYDNGCDEYIPKDKHNEVVEDVLDEIIETAIEQAAKERP